MTEYKFLVEYNGKAWVSVEADSKEEAIDELLNSCSIEDCAIIDNCLEFEVEILEGE